MQISDLMDGGRWAGALLIKEKRTGVTKTNSPYADLVLIDATGTLKAKIWDYDDEQRKGYVGVGKVVYCKGPISSYNGALQLTIEAIQPDATPVSEFGKKSRMNTEALWGFLCERIANIQETLTKFVLEELFVPRKSQFILAPAAKAQHNAWYGGLIEHTYNMMQIARSVCAQYDALYPETFSPEKVLFGVLMHDLGKIDEYDYTTPSFQYTPQSLLIEHRILGAAQIYEVCNEWWEEKEHPDMTKAVFELERAHLMHLVAAHHGRKEWGSPVCPSTIEAVLVHQIDMLDSKFMHALELSEGKEGNVKGFSEYSRTEETSYLKYT